MTTQTGFNKRVFTLESFGRMVRTLIAHRGDLRAASHSSRIDHRFAEKIMLAVTRVNGCRWCSYGHTRAALAAGVSEEEIADLMAQDLGAFPQEEAVALAFAQHYAETRDNPDPAAWERVVATYGPEAAQDILAYIRMITMGNLLGNTFDAFLSRLQGQPSATSRLEDEVGVLGGVVLVLLGMVLLPLLAFVGLLRGGRALVRRGTA